MKQYTLAEYYEVQTSLLRLERKSEALNEAVKQAKYDLRSRKIEEAEYTGTFRSLLDRLSGKREDRLEELQRNIRRGEANLETLLRYQRETEDQLDQMKTEAEQMPAAGSLRTGAETEWAELECRYCAEALEPLLEENHRALTDYRALMRGDRPEILSERTQQEIYTQPNIWAQRCRPYLLRLQEAMTLLGEPMELGGYYEAPKAYLVNVAAKHNRLDRVNHALDQVEQMQKQVKKLI